MTGARDGAIASFKLRHIDIAAGKIDQDAREVKTKFSKPFITTFFPVGDDILSVVVDWMNHLLRDKLWSLDDPHFRTTRVVVRQSSLRSGRTGPQTPGAPFGPIRAVFKQALPRQGCRISIRIVFGRHGASRWTLCRSPEEYKAWSQNLGHEHVLTTFCSYGDVNGHRQTEIIRSFTRPR